MVRLITTSDEFGQRYTAAIEAICEIGRGYTALGKPATACDLFQNSLALFEASVVPAQARLKLLIEYARSLITNLFASHTGEDRLFSTLAEARQLAETGSDRQHLADVLSLLGQADYFVTIFDGFIVDGSKTKFGPAMTYQQQALALREALQDSRGLSESHFHIGVVHERWQHPELAEPEYRQALQIAEQYGYFYERAEASRHLAGLAMGKGELDRAVAFAEQALSSRQQAQFKPFQALDHLLLSDIYLKKGELEPALDHARQASVLAEEIDYKGARVLSILRFGDIALARNDDIKARAEYEKALGLAQELQQVLLLNFANQRLERLNKQ